MVGGRVAPHGAGVKHKSKSKSAKSRSSVLGDLWRSMHDSIVTDNKYSDRGPTQPSTVSTPEVGGSLFGGVTHPYPRPQATAGALGPMGPQVPSSWGGGGSATPVGGLLAGSGLNLTPEQRDGMAKSWAMLQAPQSTTLSVDDVLKLAMAKLPQAPSVAPSLVDIGAIQKLYDQGKAAANTTAATTRTDLAGLYGQSKDQLALSEAAQRANAGASTTAQTAAAANNAVGAAGDVQGSIDMLRQNGIDPALVAGLVAQQADAAHQMTAGGKLGTDLTAANQATAQQIIGQEKFDANQSDLSARRAVDQNLVATLLGLDAKRTSAVADAQAQNASAAQQAAQANYDSQRQQVADRSALRQQLLDRAAQDGTLATPFRQGAIDAVDAHGKSGDYFKMVLDATNSQASLDGVQPTASAFMDNWDTVMKAQAKRLGFKTMPWNRDWYMQQARAYYSQDPSNIDADAAKRYLAAMG
jgi:hypothetical protein